MKTVRRFCALLLCALLTLGMTSTALAAEPADIAGELKRLLNADGIMYQDVGLNADGDYELVVSYPGTNRSDHRVTVLILKDGNSFAAYELGLTTYAPDQLAEVAMNINMIHQIYGHVTFEANFLTHEVNAVITGFLRGSAVDSAEIIHDACEALHNTADAALGLLMNGQTGTVDPLPVSPTPNTGTNNNPTGVFPRDLSVGQTVTFGTWEQDDNASNGPEPMEWRVLTVENGRALLITKMGVDVQVFNPQPASYTVWETCSLRAWLNGEFLDNAFTDKERSAIQETTVEETVNEKYYTSSGKSTRDRVFILSLQEEKNYFYSDDDRTCYPTAYSAKKNGWPTVGYGVCWTRTPGEDNYHVALIGEMGNIFYEGWWVHNEDALVRPVVWVTLG